MKQINVSIPSSRFRKTTQDLPCAQVSLLVQLRTGHMLLQKHLHRLIKVSSPKCLACHSRDKTIHHYLMTFWAYSSLRNQMERALRWGVQLIGTLLSNPKAF